MPQWATFVGVSSVVTLLLLALSHATEAALTEPVDPASGIDGARGGDRSGSRNDHRADPTDDGPSDPNEADPNSSADTEFDRAVEPRSTDPGTADRTSPTGGEPTPGEPTAGSDSPAAGSPVRDAAETGPTTTDGASGAPADGSLEHGLEDGSPASRTLADSMSTGALLANVALSQGVFAVVLVGAAVYAAIPADALGIAFTRDYVVTGLVLGTAFGLVLYVANEVGSAAATHLGFDHDEELRGMLAPDGLGGWLVLLLAVLPLVAAFEEFLFRAALIGATAAGFGISPWLLAVVSSVAFALGHGVQGSVGVAVTGLLGFVLAAGFVVTESLLVVIVAHYLINALEFVVHEGLGFDWADGA